MWISKEKYVFLMDRITGLENRLNRISHVLRQDTEIAVDNRGKYYVEDVPFPIIASFKALVESLGYEAKEIKSTPAKTIYVKKKKNGKI